MPFSLHMCHRFVILISCLFLLPVCSSAQESGTEAPFLHSAELQKYQNRYAALEETFAATLQQAKEPPRKKEFDLLVVVSKDLQSVSDHLVSLRGFLLLASMVTDDQYSARVSHILNNYYSYAKAHAEKCTELIEKTLHTSRDEEATRLMLETRDLHRSVANFLGRMQTN